MPIYNIQDTETQNLIPGFTVRFIHSEKTTFAFWEVQEGSELPEHSHPHEQISQVTEGTFELTIEGERHVLEPGMLVVIPSNASHSGKALTNCKITDVFAPVREDYKLN